MGINGVLQHDEKDCSAACLATICRYWKLNIPLVRFREWIKVDKNGANIYGIIQAANKVGLRGEALEGTWEELVQEVKEKKLELPIIVHVIQQSMEHYVVVYKITEKKVYIFDPGKGNVTYTINDFLSLWTGYLIAFKRTGKFIPKNLLRESYTKYFILLKKQSNIILAILGFSLVIALMSIISSLIFQKIVDQYAMKGISAKSQIGIFEYFYSQLNKILVGFIPIVLGLIGLYIFQIVLEYIRGLFLAFLSKRIDEELMSPFYEKLLSLPITFFQNRETGEIISRFQDISEIRDMISGSTLTLILDSIMLIAGIFILLGISKELFVIVCAIAVFYAIIIILFKDILTNTQRKIMERNAIVTSNLKEGIDGIESIKALGAENKNVLSFKNTVNDYLNAIVNGNRTKQLLTCLISAVNEIGNLLIFLIGIYLVMIQRLSIGNLIAFQGLIQYFLGPLKNLLMLQPMLQGAFIAAERLNDIMEITSEQNTFERKEDICLKNQEVILRNVDFRYGYREKILKNINLNLKPGEKVAIVGESGCGKTTLIKLLNAFYSATEGEILFGENNCDQIKLECLRKKIAYIPQNPILFNTTIKDNITYGLSDCSNEKFDEVIEGCGVSEIIKKMPFGENTVVCENGKNLSGGQQQRIAIARALIRNPEMILIDEGTSHLDKTNEEKIIRYILENYYNSICVFVMHNCTMLDRFDRIIYMREGKIICSGAHEKLIGKSKEYKSLFSNG
nr:peptidase domain-containing ABC transporter [uncultured Schaedlerella sp.]